MYTHGAFVSIFARRGIATDPEHSEAEPPGQGGGAGLCGNGIIADQAHAPALACVQSGTELPGALVQAP